MSPTAYSENKPLGFYIAERAAQVTGEHIFGVPGDFNLPLLDYFPRVGLKWIGNCNELNSGYAADGYARCIGKPAVQVSTYGVGELSALNAISGAHAECVPIVHIVGISSRAAQKLHLPVHHSPGHNGIDMADHLTYTYASKPFCVAQEIIRDINNAPDQVDHVFTEAARLSRPAYLYVPVDMFNLPVSAANLSKLLSSSNERHADTQEVVDAIVTALDASEKPVILADMLASRYSMKQTIAELLERTGAAGVTTPLSKGVIDETDSHFAGVYAAQTTPKIAKLVERDSDFILEIGPYMNDLVTGMFTRDIPENKHIAISTNYATVYGKVYRGVHFEHILSEVVARVNAIHETRIATKAAPERPSGELDLDKLVPIMSSFLEAGDTFMVETSSFLFLSKDVTMPKDTKFIAQGYYSSIGYALPAALGAGLAAAPGSRVVLVEGDGSAQMTIQELGTIVRLQVPVTIFLVNNSGYTIERAIHGPEEMYNDICPNWQWTKLMDTFGAQGRLESYQVSTCESLTDLISQPEFRNSRKPQLVEMMLPVHDYPQAVTNMLALGHNSAVKFNQMVLGK